MKPACLAASLALLSLAIATPRAAADGAITPTTQPLLTVADARGHSLGLRYQMDRREFDADGSLLDVDITHVLARAGGNILPYLQLAGEIGVCEADNQGTSGDSGLEWAVILSGNLLEHEINRSVVMESKESLRLGVDLAYRRAESDLREVNLEWGQLSLTPKASYILTHREEAVWHVYEPRAVAAHLGLVLLAVDGRYGSADIEARNDIGLMAGVDFLTKSGWVAQFGGNFMGGNDHEVSLGIAYHF